MTDPQMNACIIYKGNVVQIKDLPASDRYNILADNDIIALKQTRDSIPSLIRQFFEKRGINSEYISRKSIELNITVKKI